MVRSVSIALLSLSVSAGCVVAPVQQPRRASPVLEVLGEGPTSVAAVLKPGRTRLIVFATVWCEACAREAPKVLAWLAAAPDSSVVYVLSGSASERVRAFVEENGLERRGLQIVVDEAGALARSFRVTSTPTIFLQDIEGHRRGPMRVMPEAE